MQDCLRPAHLVIPGAPFQLEVGQHRNLVYVWICPSSGEWAIVDPHQGVLASLQAAGMMLRSAPIGGTILLTHDHWDHTNGIPEVQKRYPGTPVISQPSGNFRIGTLNFAVHPSPGHTAQGVCYAVALGSATFLMTGDTLFLHTCGRTDLPTGSDADMWKSLQRLRAMASPDTIVLPGHRYTEIYWDTLEHQVSTNPALLCKSLEELVALP